MNSVKLTDFVDTLKLNKKDIEIRKKEFDKFINSGFPSKNLEDWKFIDLNKTISSKIPNLKFLNKEVNIYTDQKNSLKNIPFEVDNYNYILSVNGFIKEINLNHENNNKIQIIREIKNLTTDLNKSLLSLNNALYYDYIKIIVKENYSFNQPLIFINSFTNNIQSTNINLKFDIQMEKNSSLSLFNLNSDYSTNNFINMSNHFKLGENAILKNYKLNLNNNSNLYYSHEDIELYKNSISENCLISGGSDFEKNDIICNLK